jgi:hypothetical protein
MNHKTFEFDDEVSDELLDALHEILEKFKQRSRTPDILVGGSFSLNVHGIVKRKVSNLNFCLSQFVYDSVYEYLKDQAKDKYFTDTPRISGEARFTLKSTGEKIYLYKHDNFLDIPHLKTVILHGRPITVFPAKEIIEYKLKYLGDYHWLCDASGPEVLKHYKDVLDYYRLGKTDEKFRIDFLEAKKILTKHHIHGLVFQEIYSKGLREPVYTQPKDYYTDTQLLK